MCLAAWSAYWLRGPHGVCRPGAGAAACASGAQIWRRGSFHGDASAPTVTKTGTWWLSSCRDVLEREPKPGRGGVSTDLESTGRENRPNIYRMASLAQAWQSR